MKKFLNLLLLFMFAFHAEVWASETGVWSYLSLIKPLNRRWSISTQTELRSSRDNTDFYLWYLDGNLRYSACKWLAVSAGIDWIKLHSYKTDSRPGIWRNDWRPYVAVTPMWHMGPIRADLNESWCWNWLPEMKTGSPSYTFRGKAFHLMRHRLTLQYPIRDTRFTPYFRCEVRHTDTMERIRYTSGTHIRLNAHATLDAGYVYEDKTHSTRTHAMNVGFRYRL